MGLNVKSGVDPDTAVKKEVKGRSLRVLKIEDIPFSKPSDCSVWQSKFTIASLDWFGTVNNLFAANEHKEIMDLLQMTWEAIFPHNIVDIMEFPAIKKLVCCFLMPSVYFVIILTKPHEMEDYRSV
jgi:hypothetical protein